jgi:hypothetical protein
VTISVNRGKEGLKRERERRDGDFIERLSGETTLWPGYVTLSLPEELLSPLSSGCQAGEDAEEKKRRSKEKMQKEENSEEHQVYKNKMEKVVEDICTCCVVFVSSLYVLWFVRTSL